MSDKTKAPRIYVQRFGQGYRETVDEFDNWREARAMVAEYRASDRSAVFYLSRRACRNWT